MTFELKHIDIVKIAKVVFKFDINVPTVEIP